MSSYHLFISYAREDNKLKSGAISGWIDAFVDHLKATHKKYSGADLNLFFDKQEIKNGDDWQSRIYQGLRSSRLFLAFVSPNYIKSEWCKKEWFEYLRLEHSLARGENGIKQIYFVEIPDLENPKAEHGDLKDFIAELKKRQRGDATDLKEWFEEGPDELLRIDAEQRLEELNKYPIENKTERQISFNKKIKELDKTISNNLLEIEISEIAISNGNIDRSYQNFVGRSTELRDLHKALCSSRIGTIASIHGLGGNGKSALAVQYAYCYSGFYASGGRWVVNCENSATIVSIFETLARKMGIDTTSEFDNSMDDNDALRYYLGLIKKHTEKGFERFISAPAALEYAEKNPYSSCNFLQPRTLVILDNLDQIGVFTEKVISELGTGDWLKIVITSRLAPRELGSTKSISPIFVDNLPKEDALALLRLNFPFANSQEETSAREITKLLDYHTLAVELIGAHIATVHNETYQSYHKKLLEMGLVSADNVAQYVDFDIRARDNANRLGLIVDSTFELLSLDCRKVAKCATIFPPDSMTLEFLKQLYGNILDSEKDVRYIDSLDAFDKAISELISFRILTQKEHNQFQMPSVACHRLISAHLFERLTAAESTQLSLIAIPMARSISWALCDQGDAIDKRLNVLFESVYPWTFHMAKNFRENFELAQTLNFIIEKMIKKKKFNDLGSVLNFSRIYLFEILVKNIDNFDVFFENNFIDRLFGELYLFKGQFVEARERFEFLITAIDKSNFDNSSERVLSLKAVSYSFLAQISFYERDFEQAAIDHKNDIDCREKIFEINQNKNNLFSLAISYANFGNTLLQTDTSRAGLFLNKANSIFDKFIDEDGQSSDLISRKTGIALNQSSALLINGEYMKALEYLNSALESAQKSDIRVDLGREYENQSAQLKSAISDCYYQMDNFEKAYKYQLEAIGIREELVNESGDTYEYWLNLLKSAAKILIIVDNLPDEYYVPGVNAFKYYYENFSAKYNKVNKFFTDLYLRLK